MLHDLLVEISRHLTLTEIAQCLQVCSSWNKLRSEFENRLTQADQTRRKSFYLEKIGWDENRHLRLALIDCKGVMQPNIRAGIQLPSVELWFKVWTEGVTCTQDWNGHRRMTVVWTNNGWRTHFRAHGSHFNSSGHIDYWMNSLFVLSGEIEVEFAACIEYRTKRGWGELVHWDNNYHQNYKVKLQDIPWFRLENGTLKSHHYHPPGNFV